MLVTLILGTVWLWKTPPGGPGGAWWCSGCRGGAQGVAVTSVIAARAADWSAMACPAAPAAMGDWMHRLLMVRGRPRRGSWVWVIAASGNRVSMARPRRAWGWRRQLAVPA